MSDFTLGLFDYINDIERENLFNYIVILIFSLFFTTKIFEINIKHIAGILLGISLIIFFNDRKESTIRTFNQEMEFKLSAIKNTIINSRERVPRTNVKIGVPEWFHTDADLINLYFNILDFQKYNPDAYEKSIIAVDNILKLQQDLKKGVRNCAENMDVMIQFKNNATNHFMTFIYSLPSNPVTDLKLNNNLERLVLLLQRHIDDAYRLCKRQYSKLGWSIDRRIISNRGPRPDDTKAIYSNKHFDLFN